MIFIKLCMVYFDELDMPDEIEHSCHILGDDLCSGHLGSPFVYNLMCWSILQLLWVTIMVVVQTMQISKGFTSYELNLTHDEFSSPTSNFGSAPTDEPVDMDLGGSNDRGQHTTALGRILFCIPASLISSKICKIIGVSQFFLVTDLFEMKRNIRNGGSGKYNYDYGFFRNWLDFLFIKREDEPYSIRNLFKLSILGEANLNGELVDYYKLYEPPIKQDSRYALV
ncbi:unnamed protein product [Ambrosiozyma monospora]|uniref:Unnamed protein product n=1 Tax=Ambrosiozyma monospora TaxID=43982 RepID=A0ACB5TBG2_AMBMO|nr:unnamed protein product [Ambrosiozyma monospora]